MEHFYDKFSGVVITICSGFITVFFYVFKKMDTRLSKVEESNYKHEKDIAVIYEMFKSIKEGNEEIKGLIKRRRIK